MEHKKGRPMAYSSFIIGLSNERLYGIDTILEEAQSKRLFQTKLFEGMEPLVARKRAYHVLAQYRRRKLPKKPDGVVPSHHDRLINAWYGWRWRIALPKEFGIVINEAAMPHIPQKRFQKPEHKPRQKHPEAFGRRLLRGLRIIMGVYLIWRSL